MPRSCTVCAHPERHSIEAALVAGRSLRDIARHFGVSKDAVARHAAEHLPPALVRAKEEAEGNEALDLLRQLKTINLIAISVLAEARVARNGDLALKAIDRIERQLTLQAKLLGELDERPVVNLLVSEEWVTAAIAEESAAIARDAATIEERRAQLRDLWAPLAAFEGLTAGDPPLTGATHQAALGRASRRNQLAQRERMLARLRAALAGA